MVLESVLWIPIVLLLLVGMVQLGKMTYVYYELKKTLYAAATYLAATQGVNFCDSGDVAITAAKNYALTGTTDGSAESPLPALTSDMIQISTECVDANTGEVGTCQSVGCDGPGGAPRPDYIVVSIPDGYQHALRIPYMLIDPILFRPYVRMPYGGT
jgi:hypothetical protein